VPVPAGGEFAQHFFSLRISSPLRSPARLKLGGAQQCESGCSLRNAFSSFSGIPFLDTGVDTWNSRLRINGRTAFLLRRLQCRPNAPSASIRGEAVARSAPPLFCASLHAPL